MRAGGRAKAAPSVRSDSSAASDKAGTLKPRSDKRRAMGRIEHSLLDRGSSSTPSDLRPSPAPPPYHTKVTYVSIYRQRAGTPDQDTPALVESLGYAHDVLLVPGAGVAHEVVGLDHRCCPSQALSAERHDNEPSRRQRRRVDNADAFKHLYVGLGIIEVSLREPIRPLRRREHGDALLAVFILDIVEAPAPRAPIRLAPHADDVEMFFGLHAPPHVVAGIPQRS